jgi:hypothetical protein
VIIVRKGNEHKPQMMNKMKMIDDLPANRDKARSGTRKCISLGPMASKTIRDVVELCKLGQFMQASNMGECVEEPG